MTTTREMLTRVKTVIREIEPDEVEMRLSEVTLLDVREPDEYEQGALPRPSTCREETSSSRWTGVSQTSRSQSSSTAPAGVAPHSQPRPSPTSATPTWRP